MSNYLKRISSDEKEQRSAQNKLAEAHAKASVEQEISKLNARKATLAQAYEASLSSNPFNIKSVFSLSKEIAENEADLELAKSIFNEEFGS